MTYQQALEYIHTLPRLKRPPTLTNIYQLMERLGNPQNRLPFVHITGTNGKGSIANMCANALSCAGYRCGLFTSPYVNDFRERFQINGQMITKEDLILYTEQVKTQVDALNQQGILLKEFEVVTAIAWLYFVSRCDIVCLEVGIGGAHDVTNIINTSLISVIGSISLDHISILGDTIEEIAKEKSGIIKQNQICVCYPQQELDTIAVCLEQCAKMGARFVQPNSNQIHILKLELDGSLFEFAGQQYQLSMAGNYQVYNAVTAITVLQELAKLGFPVSLKDIKQGLYQTRLPARFEWICKSPKIVVDGSHNLDGMIKLTQHLSNIDATHKILILAMMQDKIVPKALHMLCKQFDSIICVSLSDLRACPAKVLAEQVKSINTNTVCIEDLHTALQTAVKQLKSSDFLLIGGSFYLAGEARIILSNLDKEFLIS